MKVKYYEDTKKHMPRMPDKGTLGHHGRTGYHGPWCPKDYSLNTQQI